MTMRGRSLARRDPSPAPARARALPAFRAALAGALLLVFLLAAAPPAAAAPYTIREKPPYKELEIYGEKVFTVDDVALSGDFSRFASENFLAVPGFRYSSQLRLTLDGNLARNIRVNAQIDDTALDRDEKRFTVAVDGERFTATLGDFQTSFDDTRYTLHNKKLKGIEWYGYLPDRGDLTLLASRSEGVSRTETFVGAGMQAEFLLQHQPVVKSSETVKLDGVALKRGTDYTIDYEAGSFTLNHRLLPLESRARIGVEYEYYADGSAYRRTLLGARLRGFLSPTNRIGVTLLSDADEKGSPEAVDDPAKAPKPTAIRVAGVDFRFEGARRLEVEGEYALSAVDPNTLAKAAGDELRSGHAGRLALSARDAAWEFRLARTEMDPKFDSIGRERLSLDRELTELSGRVTPLPRLSLDFAGALGASSELGDPDLPESTTRRVAVDRESGSGALTWSAARDAKMTLSLRSRLKENGDAGLHFLETVREASGERAFGRFRQTLRVNTREVARRFDALTDRHEDAVEAGLSGPLARAVTVSMNASTLSSDTGDARTPESEVRNLTLGLTANPSPRLFASGTLGARGERRLVERRTDNSTSGDLTFQFNPSERLGMQARLREVHSRQFRVENHDPVERLLAERERETDRILRVDEPVSTATGSFMVTWNPTSRVSSLAQFQFKDIENLETRRKMAVSESVMAEVKTTPRPDLATIVRTTLSENEQLAGQPFSTRSASHGLEVRKTVARGTTLTATSDLETVRDSYSPALERDEWRNGAKVERAIGRTVVAHAGAADSRLRRFGPERTTNALTWLAGAAWTPESGRLTARANLERGVERDMGTNRTRTVLDTLAQCTLDAETSIEANYKFVNRSKSATEAGYDARIGKMTLTKRF